MSFFERIRRRPNPPDEGNYLNREEPAPGLRVVIFEDDPILKDLYGIYIRDILKGTVVGMVSNSMDSGTLVESIVKRKIIPHAAIVDGNLRSSSIGFDNWKGRILRGIRETEPDFDAKALGTGHYVCYALNEARLIQRRNLRLIGVSGTDLRNADVRFWPDVSIVKTLNQEKTQMLFRELRYAATLPETY